MEVWWEMVAYTGKYVPPMDLIFLQAQLAHYLTSKAVGFPSNYHHIFPVKLC